MRFVPGGLLRQDGMPKRQQAQLWRAAARGYRADGNLAMWRQCRRTAALTEGRPWKVDRPNG